jgi:hypothetical protein
MREQGRHVGANTEVSHLTETGYRWLGPCHSSSQVGPRGARKLALKLMFKPFKSEFTDRPTIFGLKEYL